jgi:hypothetical protein
LLFSIATGVDFGTTGLMQELTLRPLSLPILVEQDRIPAMLPGL